MYNFPSIKALFNLFIPPVLVKLNIILYYNESWFQTILFVLIVFNKNTTFTQYNLTNICINLNLVC